MQKLEAAIILIALLSLWPWIAHYNRWWYHGWLVVMLGAMVWVTVRRLGRTRDAAAEAKRKREESQRSGRPPWVG